MSVGRYRKKPVVIEAVEWRGDNWPTMLQFIVPHTMASTDGELLIIDTLEGEMTAQPGDWIIRGVAGEFYPCKPDIFDLRPTRPSSDPAVDRLPRFKAYSVSESLFLARARTVLALATLGLCIWTVIIGEAFVAAMCGFWLGLNAVVMLREGVRKPSGGIAALRIRTGVTGAHDRPGDRPRRGARDRPGGGRRCVTAASDDSARCLLRE